ncbi:MAG: tandem-95 repeat protein, partial [Betaproteobacteria bacterium]|nr:tandem-95 repeat protein [Betaproteobacteria bacterium]
MQTQKTAATYRRLLDRCLGLLAILVASVWYAGAHAAAVIAPIAGEIQFISLDTPGDHWSGGTIVVGGQNVIIPRNLLIDLPANRLTLQQLYEQAPAVCVALGETGLAKGDVCNKTGMGGIASISANRTSGGNVIAGDVFIEKAAESVTGQITYINYADGYFRVNGNPGDATTGVMVRLNDPEARHTLQQGLGCAAGSSNCSADPRFMLDANNYTNVFTTGYPMCIPSTTVRTFTDVLGLGTTSAQSSSVGTGDVLCPETNRPAGGASGMVADSRRFAPILMGDSITAEGSFETVAGVHFLSAHTTMVSTALTTDTTRGDQPDYMFFNEVFMEAPGFQNQRMRNMFIGFTTVAPADVLIWSLHYDPATNSVHEFPLGSTLGCDAADSPQSCTGQGIALGSWDIFRIRYDVDFGVGAKAKLNPCAHLRFEPRFNFPTPVCPNSVLANPNDFDTNITEMMGILQPVAHEIQARTGRKLASLAPGGTPLITLDIKGGEATNGQYLFPLGMNLGGIEVAEMNEIDLTKFQTPINFSGIPWNLDRRLSPGGCLGPCEATPQPLDPFPFEGLDPRLQAPPQPPLFLGLPQGPYSDPNFTTVPLSRASNRVLSFVSSAGTFNGDATVLAWPPADPPAQTIAVTPVVHPNTPPVAVDDAGVTLQGVPLTIEVLANDSDPDSDPLSIIAVSAVSPATAGAVVNNGTNVTFNSNSLFTGTATFTYTVSDGQGGTATAPVSVTVNPGQNQPPVANADSASTAFGTPVTVNVLANDTDANGDPLSVIAVTNGTKGTVVNNGTSVTYTPGSGTSGTDLFTYTVADGRGGSATGTVTVTVGAAPTITVSLADYIAN